MNYAAAGLMLVLATVGGISGVGAQERPEPLKNVHRIVCLGDSITQGGEGPGGYVWLLRHYLHAIYSGTPGGDIEVINAGISGHKSNDMKARFQKDVLDHKPDLVTISVGVNDVWHGFYDNHPAGDGPRGIPLDTYRANVDEMVTWAQKQGAKVVILSTTVIKEELDSPENAKLVSYNAALKDIAKHRHCQFVNFQKPFHSLINAYRRETGGRELLLTSDGVHMNPTGNRVMANTILTGLGVSPDDRVRAEKHIETEMRAGK